jgi:hypothetical protein
MATARQHRIERIVRELLGRACSVLPRGRARKRFAYSGLLVKWRCFDSYPVQPGGHITSELPTAHSCERGCSPGNDFVA